MESVDLFGHTDCAPKRVRSNTPRTEVFSTEYDLSPGERFIVASLLNDRAMEIRRGPGDWNFNVKKSDRLNVEADRYCNCGHQHVDLYCPEEGTPYRVRSFCKSRICETCGRIYTKKLREKLQPVVNRLYGDMLNSKRRGYFLSMLTLTVTTRRWGKEIQGEPEPELDLGQPVLKELSDNLPERADIARLYRETGKFFRRFYGKYKSKMTAKGEVIEVLRPFTLIEKAERKEIARARRAAKKRGDPLPEFPKPDRRIPMHSGWVAVMELGKDNNNIHCHAIVYGPYRKQERMKQEWMKITGDSTGCHIETVKSPKELQWYVLKYISKAPQTDSYQRLADYAVMIKGTRRIRSGGLFYGLTTITKGHSEGCKCPRCGAHLVMRGIIDAVAAVHHVDLWAEHRKIRAGEPTGYVDDLPLNFLPPGVTPVRLPRWQ